MADEGELLEGTTELIIGQRYQRHITVPPPGTGKDWSLWVPGGVRWRLLSLVIGYTSNTDTGNRVLFLALERESINVAMCPAGILQQPSQGLLYCWFPGAALVTTLTVGGVHTAPVPSCWLDAGWRYYLPIPGAYVGDAWSVANVLVEEERVGPPAPRQIVRTVPIVE